MSVVFFIKKLLLVLLQVPWDDFLFFKRFTEILNKKSAQRCMIHRRMATRWCILHRGMATRWCQIHRGVALVKFKKIPRCTVPLKDLIISIEFFKSCEPVSLKRGVPPCVGCPSSCGLCPGQSPVSFMSCYNQYSNCQSLATMGYCNQSSISQVCKLACAAC